MPYDFTTVLDRRGRDSIAADIVPWDVSVDDGFDAIPMWVADMAYPVAPPVLDAMRKRLEFPSLGYYAMSDAYYDSILSWQRRRHGVEGLGREHVGYENGVLGGVAAAVQAFTAPGEKILVHSPTYVGFTHTVGNLGRVLVHSPLSRDEDGIWRMDYADMEEKIVSEHIHLVIFCSPHNPAGRVWERAELEKAMAIFEKHDCLVISDEIWSDIVMPGFRHIPTQSVSEDARRRTIAFYAPSKTFSLAGLVGSYHIVYNRYLRERLVRQSEQSHYNSCNVLSMHALLGAYSPEGERWAEEMIRAVDANFAYACGFIAEHFPGVKVMRPQGTYMLFLDCHDWCAAHGVSIGELQRRAVRKGVIWQNGEDFVWPETIRMNLALPLSRLQEAMERLKQYAFV